MTPEPAIPQRSTSRLARFFPPLEWRRGYDASVFSEDALAAVIVTVMLIPQSLAYALLAGLPPETGLYASIAPLVVYAAFGTSRTLAVGPVAVISLMTAAALGRAAQTGVAPTAAAATLACLSGAMLLGLGLLRLGALASLLSHPVTAGFIAASGLLIAAGQTGRLIGVETSGDTLFEIAHGLARDFGAAHAPTAAIGLATLAFLFWARRGLRPVLVRLGLPARAADILARTGPILAVIATTIASVAFQLGAAGVAIVGDIPRGLPPLTAPVMDAELLRLLAAPAMLISVIGFVESTSVARTLAAKRRQRIDPDQELIALGGANLAAGLTGGFPVAGGFARSVVNFDAGARTPAAGAMTAVGILLAAAFLTPALHHLPKATLAAAIIAAVLSIIDFKELARVFRYSKSDGAAMAATILGVLAFGVEAGVLAGVALSLALHIWRTSRPHVAIVGQVPGTEHFRNVLRHEVSISPRIISMRIDESLYFANARFLEDAVQTEVARNPAAEHVILVCAAINSIDSSGLEALEAVNARLKDAGVRFHLSEVKGPVMDRLKRSELLEHLTGRVFLTQFAALSALDPELARRTLAAAPAKAAAPSSA